jgi:phosphomannomutase
MLAALHALAALSEADVPLSELLAPYERYPLSGEINSTVADQQAVLAELERRFADRDGAVVDRLDGLTVSTPEWSFNVRASNTEPLLRLNVEGKDAATMERLRDEVLAIIRKDA